jgi:hypothetical protein
MAADTLPWSLGVHLADLDEIRKQQLGFAQPFLDESWVEPAPRHPASRSRLSRRSHSVSNVP